MNKAIYANGFTPIKLVEVLSDIMFTMESGTKSGISSWKMNIIKPIKDVIAQAKVFLPISMLLIYNMMLGKSTTSKQNLKHLRLTRFVLVLLIFDIFLYYLTCYYVPHASHKISLPPYRPTPHICPHLRISLV